MRTIMLSAVAAGAGLLAAAPAGALAQPTDVDLEASSTAGRDGDAGPVVTGTVRDRDGGRPLPGVSVYLVESGAVAITDEQGRFELPAAPGTRLQIVALDPSYERATAVVAVPRDRQPEPIDLALVPLNLRGEEVLIEVERQRQAAGETTLRREEITRVPGSRGDVLQSVESLPGVARVNQIAPQEGLVIRGSSPADSRIFVDGFEIPILYHFGGIQSVLPSEMIESLTYTPGGFGVEYGKASAGIVSVQSRGGSDEYAGFGEVSFINTAALAQGPIGDSGNFTLGVRRSYIDAVVPLVVPEEDLSFTTLPVYYDYQARAEWAPTPHLTLTTFVFGTDDRLELATAEVDPEDPEGAASGRFLTHGRFTYLISSATWERGPVRNQLSLLIGNQRERVEIGTERFLDLGETAVGLRDEGRVRILDQLALLGGVEGHVRWSDNHLRFVRAPREGDPNPPSFTEDPLIEVDESYTAIDAAGWAAAELTPAPWLKATGGVRTDYFGRNDALVVQPRLQVRGQVAPRTALLGAVGLYSRPPDANDENLQSTDLGPERATQYSLGLEQKLGGGLELNAAGFYSDRRDLIVFAQGDRTSQMEGAEGGAYRNLGVGSTIGAEAMLRLRTDRFFGWLAYTLSRSERRDLPVDDERLFDHDQTHNLVLVGSLRLGSWQLGGRFQYVTGSPYTPVVGATYLSDSNEYRPMFGAINSQRNPANHQLDLRVDRTFQFSGWRLSAYLDVENVYLNAPVIDRDYSYDYSEREEITGLPILPSLGVRGEF